MLLTFALYFLKLTGILLAAYLPGRLFLHFTSLAGRKQPYFTAFLSLLAGFLLLAAGVAAFATGFKTVLSLYFILLAAVWYVFRNQTLPRSWSVKNLLMPQLLVILAGAIVLFASAFLGMTGQGAFGFVFPWRDNIFYALVSDHLFTTGIESFYLQTTLTDPAAARPVPYHYLELWLNATVSELTGGLYFLNFMLVTGVALRVLIYAGILALWEHFFPKVSWLGMVLCLHFLFLQGIVLEWYAEIFPNLTIIDQISVNADYLKFLSGYVFFLAFANALVRRQWLLSAIMLAGYPVAHVLALPGVLAGAGGLGLLFLFRRPAGLTRKEALQAGAFFAGGLLLLVAFYGLFGAHGSGTKSQNILLILQTFQPENQKAIFAAFKNNLLRTILVLWPFLVPGLLLLVFRRLQKLPLPAVTPAGLLFIFAACAIMGGATVSSILYQNIESHQPHQILAPVLNISLMLLLILIIKEAAALPGILKRAALLASVFLVLLLSYNPFKELFRPGKSGALNRPYQNYSGAYLNRIAGLFRSREINPVGSCILGTEDFDFYLAFSPLHHTLGLYLPYITNNSFVFSLSEFSTPFPEDPYRKQEAMDNTAAGAFYQFVKQQKAKGRYKSINQSQIDFIRQNRLGYVILSPNAPPNPLLAEAIEIEVKDPESGESFLVLKPFY